MARPRTFDEQRVIAAAGAVFARLGYSATSVDDLVVALGLHRGSLYKAFGSKRGLFVAALRRSVQSELPQRADDVVALIEQPTLDLVLIAALELAADREVRSLVAAGCAVLQELTAHTGCEPAELLGRRLLQRAAISAPSVPHPA